VIAPRTTRIWSWIVWPEKHQSWPGGCDCGAEYVSASAIARALAKDPSKSNRSIAEEIGVSRMTVQRQRERGGTNVPPEKTQGKDGKMYPAKVTRKAAPHEADQAGYTAKGGARVVIETGEVLGAKEAAKLESAASATRDRDAILTELNLPINVAAGGP
jgi:hypothetical protein